LSDINDPKQSYYPDHNKKKSFIIWEGYVKNRLPFNISCPAIFPKQAALCFHLFGSDAATNYKIIR
jgi:hypothetical protein